MNCVKTMCKQKTQMHYWWFVQSRCLRDILRAGAKLRAVGCFSRKGTSQARPGVSEYIGMQYFIVKIDGNYNYPRLAPMGRQAYSLEF